jgi:Protein of unknown function (DUF551)
MDEWISVKDSLPEFTFVMKVAGEEGGWNCSERCIIYDNDIWDGWMALGTYYKKYNKEPAWETDNGKPFNVTHWMYAPLAPMD